MLLGAVADQEVEPKARGLMLGMTLIRAKGVEDSIGETILPIKPVNRGGQENM